MDASAMIPEYPYRYSIILPTYWVEEGLEEWLQSIEQLNYEPTFEVIFVVGEQEQSTIQFLNNAKPSFPNQIVKAASLNADALNHGFEQASGQYLLFIWGNFLMDSQLLVEHDRTYRIGADVVIGQIVRYLQFSKSLRQFITFKERNTYFRKATDGQLTDFLAMVDGHFSIKRTVFERLGGFNPNLRHPQVEHIGITDFAIRLLQHDLNIHFNKEAKVKQPKAVHFTKYLHHVREWGRSTALLARTIPAYAQLIAQQYQQTHFLIRPFQQGWSLFLKGVKELMVTPSFFTKWWSTSLRSALSKQAFAKGLQDLGGIPRIRPLRVLCYHSIDVIPGAEQIEDYEEYGIPPEQLKAQLEALMKAGFHFITVEEFLNYIHHGGGLPTKPLLLTFDDGYRDVLENAQPILAEAGIPGVVFAVSRCANNSWDMALGAPELTLLSKDELIQISQLGITVGGHTRNHADLTALPTSHLEEEIVGCLKDLEHMGLPSTGLFAYPYGLYNQAAKEVLQKVDSAIGFTVVPGMVVPNQDLLELPRFEIFRSDMGWRFLLKVWIAGSWRNLLKFHWNQALTRF